MKILSLQGLRWIFALMIFFHHIHLSETSIFAPGGSCAVSFFFILSSFVLCLRYAEKFQRNEIKWRYFFIKRFLRIYPLHIFCLFFFLLLNPNSLEISKNGLGKLLLNFLLLQSWIPDRDFYFSYNPLSWYLSSLLFIYAVFPFLIRTLFSRHSHWCIAFWLLFMILSFIVIPEEKTHAIFYINPLFRVSDLLIGGGIYLICKNYSLKDNISTGWEFISIVTIIVTILCYKEVPEPYNYSVMWWFPVSLLIIIFSQTKGLLGKFLSHRISIRFGELSFTFFMTHILVLSELRTLSIYNEQNIFVQIIVSLVVQSLATVSVFYLFEKPVSHCVKIYISNHVTRT